VEAVYAGDGWWHIVFDCGHAMKALHGATSPLGEEADCFHCLRARLKLPRAPPVSRSRSEVPITTRQ
jgi:hypothetical protein